MVRERNRKEPMARELSEFKFLGRVCAIPPFGFSRQPCLKLKQLLLMVSERG